MIYIIRKKLKIPLYGGRGAGGEGLQLSANPTDNKSAPQIGKMLKYAWYNVLNKKIMMNFNGYSAWQQDLYYFLYK